MTALIFGKDELIAEWVARKIPQVGVASEFGPCRAVGVATEDSKDGRLLAGVVFHSYQPKYSTCEVSMAASNPKWCTPSNIREILAFPFLQYGANKVWVAIPHTSERVIAFVKAIGFRHDGTLTDHFGPKKHAVILWMKRAYYIDRYVRHETKEAA